MPARNPWLTESVNPISHLNPAQTDAVLHAGPTNGRKLSTGDVKTVPTVFTCLAMIKKEGGETILFAGGLHGISKIIATGESFQEVSFLPYPGSEALAAKATPEAIKGILDEANAAYRAKDDAKIFAVSKKLEEVGFNFTALMNGIYGFIDKDGFYYALFGGNKIIKATDDNDAKKPIRMVKVKNLAEDLPPELAKSITRMVGMTITYDGDIVVAGSSPPSKDGKPPVGALLLLDRDLNLKAKLILPGDAIDNSIAVDEKGGIYVVTSQRMLKVVWTGKKLSYDEADGGWQSDYDRTSGEDELAKGSMSRGSGTTPTLMGFGDDPDKLVVISDSAKDGANLVAFWRDGIPAGFKQKPGNKSARIAGQIRVDISTLTVECSPNVLGYGVAVIDATYPKSFGRPEMYANAMTAGVTRPAPLGMQKFNWNPKTHSFENAWVNKKIVSADIIVPIVSAKSGMIYTTTMEKGEYQYLGLDWETGMVKGLWPVPDDSRVWNSAASIVILLDDGDFLIGGYFALKRVNVGDGK